MQNLQHFLDDVVADCSSVGEAMAAPIHTVPDGEGRHRKKILKHIEDYPLANAPKSLHLGVAGYFNFDVIAKTRPEYLILLDANKNQERFWKELFAMMAEQPTFSAFSEALAKRTVPNGFVCNDGTILDKRFGSDDAMKGLEALQHEGVYDYLYEMAKQGRTAFTTVNLVNEKEKCERIGSELRAAGFHTQTAYWSNIGTFFHPSRRGRIVSKSDDIFGHEEQQLQDVGIHYKNIGFYKSDAANANRWTGYASQEERNQMSDAEVPAYERFLENTSALGGLDTLHMHSHASDKLKNIKRYPLILSQGPLRRLPEQIEVRENMRNPSHPDWQARIGDEPTANEKLR